MNWYLAVLKKYVDFEGRARRMEYWMFTLVNFIIYVVAYTLIFSTKSTLLSALLGLYGLAILLPSLGVTVRRLHDTGRTGWWILIGLVPFIGTIVLLIFMILDGDEGQNQYGPSPK
jgi:uncharacterized membrane protein YhaH (DUF805 family)